MPDDPGYGGFDDYGQDTTLARLSGGLRNRRCDLFSVGEFGRGNRPNGGSVTLTADPELAAILDRLPALRRWNASETLQKAPGLCGGKTN